MQHLGDKLGRVLQIGIHGNRRISRCLLQAGGKSGLLAEIAGQIDNYDFGIFFKTLLENLQGIVRAAIIDKDEFQPVIRQIRKNTPQPFDKGANAVRFVMAGHDYAYHRVFVHYGSPGLFIICACPHINIMGKGIFAWYLQYDSSVNCIEILDVIQ